MIQVKNFVFSEFQENSYLLYDETGECVLVDPGCYRTQEKEELSSFISSQGLKLKKVIYTHCHMDHTFGAYYVESIYPGMQFEAHQEEKIFIDQYEQFAAVFGITMDRPPSLTAFLEEGDTVTWGKSSLEVYHVPGHSPGSLCFYAREEGFVIVGDVLFAGSIGRTDLPGGNMHLLLGGIRDKLFTLPPDCVVLSGHGPSTTIGAEKQGNPFF